MQSLRMETTVLPGHRLEIPTPELPEGTAVEVTVVVKAKTSESAVARAAALDQLLTLARASSFRSVDPYPSRDALHERH